MTINTDKLRSPQIIFFIYTLAAFLLIMIFRFIFPGSESPLPIYARNWRLVQGALEFFYLFPALALSALIIPFGLGTFEENYHRFSDVFFKRILNSVTTAIIAAVLYAIIFFLAFPVVKNSEENYRFSGDLYKQAKKHALESIEAGEWKEAAQFVAICDRIWFKNEDLEKIKDKIAINIEEDNFEESDERAHARSALAKNKREASGAYQKEFALSEDQNPVDATQAIEMSVKAFNEKRYFDSHWLANLGVRLSPAGSVQQTNAARQASDAWNMIASQAPTRREEKLAELYNMKLSGYNAMNSDEWIEAYYIFQELLALTPDDPDAAKFLAVSERGANSVAFFIDEMNLSLGEIINGALFSLPVENRGRAVLRFSTLTISSDIAYGMGFEYMKFDALNNLQASVMSRYAKIMPFLLNDKPQILILTHALDRDSEERGAKAEWLAGAETPGGIIVDINYEDFLLITNVRRGLPNLQILDLYSASKKLDSSGYISQIFHAEIINRIGSALFFLPMAVIVIIIAWRYRAKKKPRYFFFLLLPILPIIFHGFVFLYRSVFNTIGIWLVISFGFFPALIAFIVILALSLLISLITLSAQHG